MDTAKLLDIDHLRSTGAVPHFFGLGFVQLKLNDAERLHFYHPDAPCITGQEEVHNHRYFFRSWILKGELEQFLFDWAPGAVDRDDPFGFQEGDHTQWLVSCKPGQSKEPISAGRGHLRQTMWLQHSAGSSYSIQRQQFHTVDAKRAVTFLRRGEVETHLASVIRPNSKAHACPFSAPKPEAQCWEIIRDLLSDDHG